MFKFADEGTVGENSKLVDGKSNKTQEERTELFHKAWKEMRDAGDDPDYNGVLKFMKDDPVCDLQEVAFVEDTTDGKNTQLWLWSNNDTRDVRLPCSTPHSLINLQLCRLAHITSGIMRQAHRVLNLCS